MIDVGQVVLGEPGGPVFMFEPGSLALAFAATGTGSDGGPRAQTLTHPRDLELWADDIVGVTPAASRSDLRSAVRLQAAIWSVVDAIVDHRPVADADRDVLNHVAAEPSLIPQLLPGRVRALDSVRGMRSVLSAIARDAIDLVGGPRAARLRRCEGSGCVLLFVDTSRSGRRRWCSMERCGNRAKVAAHRRRRKEID